MWGAVGVLFDGIWRFYWPYSPLFMRWICCGHHMAMSVHLPFFCSAVCVGLRHIA